MRTVFFALLTILGLSVAPAMACNGYSGYRSSGCYNGGGCNNGGCYRSSGYYRSNGCDNGSCYRSVTRYRSCSPRVYYVTPCNPSYQGYQGYLQPSCPGGSCPIR